MTIMRLWHDKVAIEKAGENPEKAKNYSEDDSFLLEKEETSALYDVFYEQ